MKPAKKKQAAKKKRKSKKPVKQELRSKYFPVMKLASVVVFILLVGVSIILLYGLTNFYGIDMSNQITSAATANITP